jgi:hypothetical protein
MAHLKVIIQLRHFAAAASASGDRLLIDDVVSVRRNPRVERISRRRPFALLLKATNEPLIVVLI